ncbi:MAG: DUF29 domain-containing protein [Thiotrichaceae bacterium]|nr:DUF29 domain-containing protein [Thiotrichaceae bacterium]
MSKPELYHQDFDAWIHDQISLLKAGKMDALDTRHLIEELEDMGKNNRRELSSHLKILIAHLLKWQFQLAALSDKWESYEGKSWRLTIIEQRSQIVDLLEDVPSLKRELESTVEKSYPKAVLFAVKETRLAKTTFPETCPYTIQQLLDDEFFPEAEF